MDAFLFYFYSVFMFVCCSCGYEGPMKFTTIITKMMVVVMVMHAAMLSVHNFVDRYC